MAVLAPSCGLVDNDDRAAPPSSTTSLPAPSTTRGSAGGVEPFEIQELAWEPCGRVECATLTVPVDWDDPQGTTPDLAVARRPATDAEDRLGAVMINPGGPGGSGVQLIRTVGDSSPLGRLGEQFDLVSFDPRGVGASQGMDCADDETDRFRLIDPSPDTVAEQDDLDDAARAVVDACLESDPDLAVALGTNQTVEDIETLRIALGEDQINWLGFSYGTYLGLRYADAYPEQVRAVVLDGVVDPSVGLEELNTNQARAFEQVLDDAGLLEQARRVVQQVEDEPLSGPRGVEIGPAVALTAVVAATYDEALMDQLGPALDGAEDGNPTALIALATTYWSFGDFPAYVGTICADFALPRGSDEWQALADRMAAAAPLAGASVANELLPCAYWPDTGAGEAVPIRATGVDRILVIGNTGDAPTPIAQARAVADQLDNAVLLRHDGEGHGSFNSSECVQDVVLRLFIDLELPAVDARC